jgi:hypothetical protein
MNNRADLQNQRLRRIERQLLEAARVSEEEIETIVAAPRLFDSVKARIEAEKSRRRPKGIFGGWSGFPVWNRPGWVAALAVLTFIILGAASLIVFNKQDVPAPPIEQANAPEIEKFNPPVENPSPPTAEESPEIGKSQNFQVKKQTTSERAAFKSEKSKLQNRGRRAMPAKRLPRTENVTEGPFYALTYTGNLEEDGEDLQIIRTELSRSSLFALGVNLPVENETAKIKTDLLVGTDGVARAIRFVK